MLAGLGAAVAVGAAQVGASAPPPDLSRSPALAAPAPASRLLVFVSGAVAHPGLYRLASGARITDAISAAGGVLPNADAGHLPDLAAVVHDGRQVNVPFARRGRSASQRVEVNSAPVEELATVPGVSRALAEAVVAARASWGPFHSLADLRDALGLDSRSMTGLSRYLSFAPP